MGRIFGAIDLRQHSTIGGLCSLSEGSSAVDLGQMRHANILHCNECAHSRLILWSLDCLDP